MSYGTTVFDNILTSGNLSITGNILPTGGIYSPMTPGRNRIINGAMGIDQRNAGASQTITAAAALAYTIDRWYAYSTGANVTGQRVSNAGTTASPSQYAYQFTGAASVTAIGFAQRIEAVNCYDLAGSTATLSVTLANSLLTTVTWTAYYATTTDTFGTLASPTKTQIATGTFTVSGTNTRYSTQITVPSAATTGIEIVFTVGAQTSGTWVIGNVQLEAGTLATVFERRMFGQELLLSQRYFYRWTSSSISTYNYITYIRCYSTTNGTCIITLPTNMRIVPTMSTSSFSSSNMDYVVTVISQTSTSADNRTTQLDITGTFSSGAQSIAMLGTNGNTPSTTVFWIQWNAEL
jgi:hypothetical protein